MPTVTTQGLRENGTAASAIPEIAWAVAAGSADVIIAAYDEPNTGLTDGLALGFRATAANATTTPVFNPDGLGAGTIVKHGNQALLAGDIPNAGYEALVRYRASTGKWELLNPARDGRIPWAAAAGTANAITANYTPDVLALTDGLVLSFRALLANTTTAPTFTPDGLTAHSIVKLGGVALVANDIAGLGHEVLVRYDLANTRWELLNPKYTLTSIEAYTLQVAGNSELFKVLAADDTGGTNVNTAQPWFPTAGAVSVEADTTYLFEGLLHTTRAAGTTSHTTGLLFGGTATLTDIRYLAFCKEGDANDLQDISGFIGAAATELVVKAASTSGTENIIIHVKGIIRINAAGTLIPQFKYSAAPGGTPTIKAESFFRMVKLGTGAVVTKGTWA